MSKLDIGGLELLGWSAPSRNNLVLGLVVCPSDSEGFGRDWTSDILFEVPPH